MRPSIHHERKFTRQKRSEFSENEAQFILSLPGRNSACHRGATLQQLEPQRTKRKRERSSSWGRSHLSRRSTAQRGQTVEIFRSVPISRRNHPTQREVFHGAPHRAVRKSIDCDERLQALPASVTENGLTPIWSEYLPNDLIQYRLDLDLSVAKPEVLN